MAVDEFDPAADRGGDLLALAGEKEPDQAVDDLQAYIDQVLQQ
ncbi:hypothetical protein ACFQL0_07155 [Haloplanus litoreus]